jgi:lipopolysaccharide/colanic/teichoic acid biosynthesis glycosyltransferase
MSISNRMELAPYILLVSDFVLTACAGVAVLPVGAAQAFVPLVVLAVIYATGDYSLLAEFRSRARLGVPFACLLFLTAVAVGSLIPSGSWVVGWEWKVRAAAAVGGCLLFAVAHYGLEGFLRSRSQRCILYLGAGMEEAGEALRRHVARSRYPADVVVDPRLTAAADKLPVEVLNPRADAPSDPRVVSGVFDPARFCDVVLKVLPPAVLEVRRGYVSWEALKVRSYDVLKRGADIVAASFLLLVGLPFMAVAVIGILIADGRPVLFRQTRVGRFGTRFSLVKFRTLRVARDEGGTPNDDIEQRVFRFGSFLRRTRLDELPQFFNVLRGDMSVIGPRPEMEYFHDKWVAVIPFYRQRLIVRPGISGWAQVRFPHTTTETDYWDKTAYDLWYIRHRSAFLDIRISLRTAGVMLFGFGAR